MKKMRSKIVFEKENMLSLNYNMHIEQTNKFSQYNFKKKCV